jgi:membrane protease YdiL (CAAX protease family)
MTDPVIPVQLEEASEVTRPKPVAPIWHTILLLVLIVGLSALQRPQALAQANLQPPRLMTYSLTLAYELFLLGLVYLGLWLYKVPLREIIGGRWKGLGDFFRDVGVAILFWFVVAGMLLAAHFYLGFSGVDAAKSMFPQTPLELALFVVLAVVAGFCEEIVFRGYMQRQFTAWTRNAAGGVILQAVVFGCAHMYQGWKGVAVISLYGALFGVLAAICKSLRPGMLQHCTQDALSGIAVWFAQKHHFLQMIVRF